MGLHGVGVGVWDPISIVVMDVAAFKVGRSCDIDATTLAAARVRGV